MFLSLSLSLASNSDAGAFGLRKVRGKIEFWVVRESGDLQKSSDAISGSDFPSFSKMPQVLPEQKGRESVLRALQRKTVRQVFMKFWMNEEKEK